MDQKLSREGLGPGNTSSSKWVPDSKALRSFFSRKGKSQEQGARPPQGDTSSSLKKDGSDMTPNPTDASRVPIDDITRFHRNYTDQTRKDQTAPKTSEFGFSSDASALMADLGDSWFPSLSKYEFKSVELVSDEMVRKHKRALQTWNKGERSIRLLDRFAVAGNYKDVLNNAELIKKIHAAAGTLMLGTLMKGSDLHTKLVVKGVDRNAQRYKALRQRLSTDLCSPPDYFQTYEMTEKWNLAIEQFRKEYPSAYSEGYQKGLQDAWRGIYLKTRDDPELKSRLGTLKNTMTELETALKGSDRRVISQRLREAIRAWDQATQNDQGST